MVLPMASSALRGKTPKERACDLVKSRQLCWAGTIYWCLGRMVFNSEDLILTCTIFKEDIAKAKEEKAKKIVSERTAQYEAAFTVYKKFKFGDKLLLDDYKILLKFICPEGIGDDVGNPSKYTRLNEMRRGLKNVRRTGGFTSKTGQRRLIIMLLMKMLILLMKICYPQKPMTTSTLWKPQLSFNHIIGSYMSLILFNTSIYLLQSIGLIHNICFTCCLQQMHNQLNS